MNTTYWYHKGRRHYMRCYNESEFHPLLCTAVHQNLAEGVQQFEVQPTVDIENYMLQNRYTKSDEQTFEAELFRYYQRISPKEFKGPDGEARTQWMGRTMRCITSNNLPRLLDHALQNELYEEAAVVRDEIDRRIEKGFMMRLEDGSVVQTTIRPPNKNPLLDQ